MNRLHPSVTALLSALMPLIFDSALKGAVLLAGAAVCALLLHNASAAMRHLVWLVAVVALLIVPVLSVALPQWRVLPTWAASPLAAAITPTPIADPSDQADSPDFTPTAGPEPQTASLPAPFPADTPLLAGTGSPTLAAPASDPTPRTPESPRTWRDGLPLAWAAGCALLVMRLLAAHLLLRHAARRCPMLTAPPDEFIVATFAAASTQLGITQRVTLLLDEKRTIPVVWGVFRPRLLLPAEARGWSGEQLRSVLLHELAHIRRRDTLAQWLTQIACALHWWNPLVWLAAWRLHIERERACDDLVLAHGVRPSAYAEHLLHVATRLSPARWTQACGLAMARKSSLEGRLLAVLSEKLNRRGVTSALAGIALLLGAGIAIPVAMLRAADDHPSAKKLATLIAAIPLQELQEIVPPSAAQPKHKDARTLFEIWQRHARSNGDIPGAFVGELTAAVKTFIGYNPNWETVPKLNAILPSLDATRDWKSADAIALLDEVAAVQDSPVTGAAEKAMRSTIRKGETLPNKFADAGWGDAQPNGLRAAWVLEPGATEHRMGAALKARLLVQNSGQVPVMVNVPTWYQGEVKASDARGAEVEVSGLSWTTIAQLVPVRLGPGEFIEIHTPGIGLGPRAGIGPWAGPRVGSNVLAKSGDELTLTHSLVPVDGSEVGVREDDPHVAGPGWWLAHIKTRLNRELPLPADAVERTRLLDRAVRELFATAPTAEETATFVADQTPGAFDALVQRLAARTDVVSFSGKLPAAPAKLRVLAADAKADDLPRVVLGPGEYPLPSAMAERGDATLKIAGRPVGDRRTNDAQLLFEPVEFTGILPPDPYKLEVPDGWGTWAIVCRPSDGFFYLLHKGGVRKIDYSAPRKVTDTPANDLPAEFRDEVKRQLDIHEISDAQQAEVFEKPAPPATTPEPKTGANVPASDEAPLKPKHEYAQKLFQKWQASARTDGKIPGALIGHVAQEVDGFLKQHPADEKAPQLAALLPRLDASRDWTQAEVVALLDDITAISTAPVSWANSPMEFSSMRAVQGGEGLPIELTSAAWGQPVANGLRAAWLLEPRGEQYALGSVLKARVLFHNTGKAPVVFQTETWHQHDGHTARDAKGAEIPVKATWFTGVTPMATFRLAPGEYCEVSGHGIAIGAGEYKEEHSTGAVGAIIEAKEGDAVTLSHEVDTAHGGWTRPGDPKDPLEFWKATIAERIANEAPMPASATDRAQLIRRVTLDILGVVPTAEEIAAFTADEAPDALTKLTARLQAKPRVEPFSGKLPTGETTFRVIAADPNAAKAPRTANSPGRYVLGDNVHLLVSQLTEGDKRTNKAVIAFLSPDPNVASPHKPHEIALPDGIGTYGIVWDRGASAVWVMQKGMVRKYEFANPSQVQEMKIEPGNILNIPAHLQEPMKKAFDVAGGPVQQQNLQKPKTGARLKPATEQKLKWGEPANGLRMALAWPPTLGEPGMGDAPEFYLVVQNVSEKAVRLTANDAAPNPRMLNLYDATLVSRTVDDVPIPGDWLLQPREAAFLRLFHSEQKFEDGRTSSVLKENVVSTLGQYSYTAEMTIGKAPAGAWTGKLVTGATRGSADVLDVGKPIALRSAPPMSWGVPKDGLRGAWRINGELLTGGQAKAELWVWNASTDVVKFSWTERADIGLAVMISDGTNPAREAPVTRDKKDFQLYYLVLPAGQAVKLKEFAVRLGSAPNDAPAGTVSLPLTPGDWTLQAKWSDTRHIIDAAPEWHGVLDTGEVKLKVTPEGATVAETAPVKAKWPPVRQKTEWSEEFLAQSKEVAEARGTPDANPEDLIAWGEEETGLRAGLLMAPRVTLGGQLPTRMVLRNVSGEAKELGLSISLNRLDARARTPDGNVLMVRKVVLFGTDASYQVTLKPGEQVEFEGPPVQFGMEMDPETKLAKTPKYPICGVETGAGKVHVHFKVEAKTGEAVVEVVAAKAGEDAGKSKGKATAKLDPGTEAQLDWGDAVNGLRAAVVVRSPQPGVAPGIFLAVQNVSAAALRFTDSMAAKEQRKLYLSDSAGILMALTSSEPAKTDAVLPPRGVLFLPMFPEDLEKKGEAALIEGIRKDSLQTWRAVLNIENAPEGAWKGKLTTAETRGAVSADGPQPKNEAARALFKFWQRSARLNGDIPGGLLTRLHDKVKEFIRHNTGDASGDPYAKKMTPLEPRFGPAGDWKPADVVALLDDIAAVTTIPLKTTLLHHGEHTLRHGQPLPAALEKADWGEPLAGGLRMAFLLEPRAAEYHLGTEVKARILLHNSSKEAVAFITGSFHQPGHKAHLADGGELKLDASDWLEGSVPQAWRLAPGEYIEVNTPGLGIGAHDKERAEWSDVRAGSWILCSGGDEVTFLPGGIMLSYDDSKLDGEPRPWWPDFIAERLSREAPVPLDTTEREHLLYRVVRDLFGTAPSTTEGDAFAADKSPDALKNLAVLLTKHKYGTRCEGPISAGETKFRVLPPDPDAAKKPRVAMNPGRYTLGGYTTLVVTRRPDGRRIVNEAHLSYNPPEETIPAPHHKVELPDGYDTWAVASVRGETGLWLSQKGRLLKIDFTNFGKIQETRYEGDKTATAPIPADIRDALGAALTVPDAPKQIHEPLKPAAATPASPAASPPALEAPKTEKPKDGAAPAAAKRIPPLNRKDTKLLPATEQKLKWGDPVNGLRAALVMHPVPDEPDAEDKSDIFLVVQNVTKAEIWLHASDAAPNPRKLIWREKGILETINETARPIPADFRLQPGEVAFFRMTHPPAKPGGRNEGSVIAASIHHDPIFDLTGKMEIEKAPAGAWTGKLLSGEIKGGTAIPVFSPAENQIPASDAGAPPKKWDPIVPSAERPKGAEGKITPDALPGFWRGTVNEEELMLSFYRPPVERDVQLDIYFGKATIGAPATFTIAADGGSAAVVQQSAGGGMPFGTLIPAGEGMLKLELFGRQTGQMELVLTRDADAPATEPRQKEPRELFEMWKRTANADGTFPGTFIGALATEVRAYIKANPNLDSGMKLPKLLPRFVTSRDWTQAEAIKLLDDVAYYATEPIAARVAKATLPSGPLWRTEVEFADIPVKIAKWSEAKDGLRLGMSVVEANWRVGGRARVELWLHNAGGKDVTFKSTGPDPMVAGVAVSAIDAESHEHPALTMMKGVSALPMNCTLLAGHVAMAKKFEVTFVEAEQQWNPPGIQNLKPGKYQLRSKWMDAHPTISQPGDWTGELTAPDMEFTLAAQDAPKTVPEQKPPPADGKPVSWKLADDRYAKSGVALVEQIWPMPPWGAEKDGLSAGIRIIGDARIGGEVRAELWARNSSTKDVKFSQSPRADVGLSVVAMDKDGKKHSADITQFRGFPVFSHLLLPPGHIVKVKEFTVKFGANKNDKLEWGWVNLQVPTGDYKLRAKWSDAASHVVPEGEWTGELTTGEVELTIAAADAPAAKAGADAAPEPVIVPDDQYVKSGFPADELVGEGVMWNDVGDGLLLGYRITGDEWRILGKELKVELWVRNPSDKDVKFQLNMRPDIGLRMILKDEKGTEHESSIVPTDVPPFGEHRLLPPGHALKVKEFSVSLLWPENDVSGIKGHFFAIAPGAYNFHCELEMPGLSATGEGGRQLTPAAGEWTGKLTTRDTFVMVMAPDAPPTKPRVESVEVMITKDGEVSLDRTNMSLDELKTRAGGNAKKWFTIRADKDVPYAKVVDVVEALKAVGVTEFSFSEARVGDGKYRVANRQANYDFDGKHRFSICRPTERPQWFTVGWPAEGERPACWLRTFPNVGGQTQGKWAVVWEPGTDVLWWVDDSDVGKMTLTDPVRVIVDREGRTNNFSRDFGLPEEVKTAFRRLGFVIGRDKTPGLETAIGGNTGGQSIVSAEAGAWSVKGTVTDADGKPLADVPVRVTTNQELKTEKTDAKGEYRAYFDMPLELLAHWRAVTVEPVLEGFTERDMAKAGEFNVLLRPGEEPQRVRIAADANFEPGPIPRFTERDLIPSQPGVSPGNPGRADFVMLKADEVTGEIVTADGKPAPPHFIAAATPEQRPGHNAAIEKSDAQGHFRLKGIPTNKPVIFTVNPDGKPGATSKSSEQKFEQTGEHKLRIVLPAEGSGKGAVKIERLTDGAGTVPLPKPAAVSNEPMILKFAAASDLFEAAKKQYGPTAASAILSVDNRAKTLTIDAGHPDAAKVREFVTTMDQSHAPGAWQKGGLIVRAQGVCSEEWQALSKVVAESRGLADWKPDDVIAWGPEEDGLRSGMLIPTPAILGDTVKPLLVLRNVSGATKELQVCTSLNVLTPSVRTADGKSAVEVLKVSLLGNDATIPVTLMAGEQFEFAAPPVQFGVERDAKGIPLIPKFPTAGVVTGAETLLLHFNLLNVRGPETGAVAIQVAAPNAMIRGKVLKPDGTAAAGVQVRVDDGIERWKFRGEGIPDLPKAVTTAADGTFSIEVPKRSVATNYEAFASSDEFAPLNAEVPAGGDVGVMQFAKGSSVTGRVFGLDGAGLAKVGIWCKQLDWHGRGPAPSKLTSTDANGTFSIPSIATGKYVLVILTRDLGAKELAVAFANPVIETKDDAPVAVEIRPLPTVDLTLNARVLRGNAEFRDFELRVSGTLPGHQAGDPAGFWTRQETTKLTEGKHTIAVPAGLQNATVRADRIYMRKGDEPVFSWRRESDGKRVVNNMLELGLVDKPQTIGVTVQDAEM